MGEWGWTDPILIDEKREHGGTLYYLPSCDCGRLSEAILDH